MSNEEGLNPAQQELESALGNLQPVRAAFDRDQLMFSAGLRAGRRVRRLWRGISGMLVVMCMVSLLWQPLLRDNGSKPEYFAKNEQGSSVESYMNVTFDFSPVDQQRIKARDNYLMILNRVLTNGLDELPESSSSGRTKAPTDSQEMLEQLLSS